MASEALTRGRMAEEVFSGVDVLIQSVEVLDKGCCKCCHTGVVAVLKARCTLHELLRPLVVFTEDKDAVVAVVVEKAATMPRCRSAAARIMLATTRPDFDVKNMWKNLS